MKYFEITYIKIRNPDSRTMVIGDDTKDYLPKKFLIRADFLTYFASEDRDDGITLRFASANFGYEKEKYFGGASETTIDDISKFLNSHEEKILRVKIEHSSAF